MADNSTTATTTSSSTSTTISAPSSGTQKVEIEIEIDGNVNVEKRISPTSSNSSNNNDENNVVKTIDETAPNSSSNDEKLEGSTNSNNNAVAVQQQPPAPPTPSVASTTTSVATDTAFNIEDEVGHLSGEYPCAHNHIQGALYAGSKGFTFKGTVFFYKCHFHVQWKHVQHIVPTELGYIAIHVVDREGGIDKEYIFTQLQHADRIWATLVALQSESKQGERPMLENIRASLRRLSSTGDLDSGETGDTEAAYVAAVTAATMDDLRLSLKSNRRISVTPKPDAETPELTCDLEAAWEQLHDHPKDSYKEAAFENQEVPCSLDDFERLFLSDGAPEGFVKFMTDTGDLDVAATAWSNRDEDNNKNRTVEYSHPINAPLAPPKAHARKEQRLRRFGDRGISLETDTYVDDVPMTDCFFVTDRILISSSGPSAVTVSAYFDIRFVKSTMFRSIISNTTRSEFLKWFASFSAMVRREAPQQLMEQGKSVVETSESDNDGIEVLSAIETVRRRRSSIAVSAASSDNNSTTMKILIGLMIAVLLFQIRIMSNMNRMQHDMMIAIQDQQMCVSPTTTSRQE